MHRNITAIYRTHAVADLVRRELAEEGISQGHIHVIPDRDDPVASGGTRDDSTYSDALHDLHLPDDDLRTYQHSVRRGDYVVSAEVDESQVTRVQQIMRRPEEEAYNLDTRDSEFRNEELVAPSAGGTRSLNEQWLGRRVPEHNDPYTRTYERNARLDETRRT